MEACKEGKKDKKLFSLNVKCAWPPLSEGYFCYKLDAIWKRHHGATYV